VPRLGGAGSRQRLQEIPGLVPRLDELPPGCRFADRCPRVQDRCKKEEPELVGADRLVRCFFPVDNEAAA
jgi:oligopeptide/dipeptide ABC transporter ATP-binding protein